VPALGEYDQYDAVGLAQLVRDQEVNPEELLEAAIERVNALNPMLNAVVTPMYGAAKRAISRDLPDGPFRGVPFLLKDIGTP
jgi:Asp-tRNA(Asn)/Glu-tRNA(Gln) amidotransferase A subunit family amidase